METGVDTAKGVNMPTALPETDWQADTAVFWLEEALPRLMRRLMDSENLDMPLLQLPLAQMRLAQALYRETSRPDEIPTGETMGRLSERLGVRHNALTQAADRLINHGLAERASDPADRRIVRLRLTEKGREWVAERRDRRRAHLRRLWELLNAGERQEFMRAVLVLEAAANRLDEVEATEPAENGEPSGARELPTVEETLSRFVAGAAAGRSRTKK